MEYKFCSPVDRIRHSLIVSKAPSVKNRKQKEKERTSRRLKLRFPFFLLSFAIFHLFIIFSPGSHSSSSSSSGALK
jgi:hypothetical protein